MDRKETEESWKMFESAETGEIKETSQEISSFFSRFGNFFDSDAKKAVFLEGVLTGFLLDVENNRERLFKVDLNSLNLDEEGIKKVLPKVQNRLEGYGKNNYQPLQSIISKYFVLAGDGWKMSNGEIGFYFVLGMNLAQFFTKERDGEDLQSHLSL